MTRGEHTARRVVPPDERLVPYDRVVRQADDGLVGDGEFSGSDATSDLVLHLKPLERLNVHRLVEEAPGRPARDLGPEEGGIAIVKDTRGVRGGVGQCYPDGRRGNDLVLGDVQLDTDLRGDALGDPLDFGRGTDLRNDDDELVAPEAPQFICGAQSTADAPGHRRQDLVADDMAQGIIDDLEVVQIDEHQGEPDPRAMRGHHVAVQPVQDP